MSSSSAPVALTVSLKQNLGWTTVSFLTSLPTAQENWAPACPRWSLSLLFHGPKHFALRGLIFPREVCLDAQSRNTTDLISQDSV